MRILRGLDEAAAAALDRPVCTVGVFDGVHRGHRQILYELRVWAQAVGGTPVVVTFARHPRAVLGGIEMPMILTLEHRLLELERHGVAAVADCKYKLLDDGIGRAPDYYQALAYATAYDVPEAWLIYARFRGDVSAADVPIRHVDKTVRTFGIDLTGPIEFAIEQVRALGELIVGTTVGHKVQLAAM